MKLAIGVDCYNHATTGGVSKILTAMRVDVSNLPCVLILNSSGGVSQERLMQAITKGKEKGKE